MDNSLDVAEEMVEEYIWMGASGSIRGSGQRCLPGGVVLQYNGGGCPEIHRGGRNTQRGTACCGWNAWAASKYYWIVLVSW